MGFHSKRKHIDLICHWVRDVSDAKSLELSKIQTDKNVSGVLMKVVTKEKQIVEMVWGMDGIPILARFFMESEREGLLDVSLVMKKQQIILNNFTCLRKGTGMHCGMGKTCTLGGVIFCTKA